MYVMYQMYKAPRVVGIAQCAMSIERCARFIGQ